MAKKNRLTGKGLQMKVALRWAEIMGIDPVTLKFIPKKRVLCEDGTRQRRM